MSGANSLASKNRSPAWDPESVLGVAIINDATDVVHFMPRPARHHDVIRALVEAGVPAPIAPGQRYRQGFMTVLGFKDREMTAKLIGHKGLLTSEDLW